MNIADIRAKFPQYDDLSDGELVRGLHAKFYSDMPYADFLKQINFRQHVDAAEGMSSGDQFLAGVGKSFSDTGLGLEQLGRSSLDALGG